MDKFSRLTGKYFEGKTSLREEQQLRDYYRRGKIIPGLKPYKPVFDYLNEERNALHAEKSRRAPKIFLYMAALAAACALLPLVPKVNRLLKPEGNEMKSYACIDARKITDLNIIGLETLNSLENIAGEEDAVYALQAEMLETFTEKETDK
jgi:hypothetical protein